MLAEATGVRKIYIACGYTDLRKGIDGLTQLVGTGFDLNPFQKDVLFLFCGKRCDRIKGLLWEGTGSGVFTDTPAVPSKAAQMA